MSVGHGLAAHCTISSCHCCIVEEDSESHRGGELTRSWEGADPDSGRQHGFALQASVWAARTATEQAGGWAFHSRRPAKTVERTGRNSGRSTARGRGGTRRQGSGSRARRSSAACALGGILNRSGHGGGVARSRAA